MPTISERGMNMPPSPIRKLVPYAEKAKREGRIVYHLNIGQPDIHTPAGAIDAVKHLNMEVIEYSHSAGTVSYRNKLANFYLTKGIRVTPEDILVTTGGSEALSFGMVTCLNPGEEVIVPEPFYANYYGFSFAAGVQVVPLKSTIETSFALPPIQEIEKLITPRTKAILICNPNNPTGYRYSRKEIEQLGAIVKKHDLFLFSDEVYREFCYDTEPYFSVMELEGMDKHVVLIDSVSKRYSACGVRIGAMISRNPEIIQNALKLGQARLSPPSLGQILGEAAIETPASYFEEVKKEYIARRDYIVRAMNEIPGVYCPNPLGAFYVIAQLPVHDADHFAEWLLSDFSLDNQTVMLAPASGFYSTPGAGKDQVRIAYVLKVDHLKKAVACLKAALEVYPGRK